MKRLDKDTIQRVIDTADIVEVVSDFVTLKRSGSSYMGLCPFHNERTPSFSVSKSKGICKCFSCGKGGNVVSFLMELEQLSFQDAIRWLARKYNIEIKEHEVSEDEREADLERESLFAVNQFALEHFEHNISDTDEGKNVGYEYFRERGINDAMIKRFHLGYSMRRDNALTNSAIKSGYNDKYLLAAGLSGKSEKDNHLFDKYRERVIYPIYSMSGRVIGFGGRILSKDKSPAKYINSPENAIYHKSYTLYGLYQAKQSIVKNDKCIIVEGYMDVISMHQSGVENVVASSGTSLTVEQVRLIHRLTSNVTVVFDADPAGIKASLRGIDLFLEEGINVKVLLLPEGEDPDSFAQHHSSTEVEEYIAKNEIDFLRFKTKILLEGKDNDPIARSNAINDIVRSIALIPNPITRAVYINDCSRMMEIPEKTISLQVNRSRNEYLEKRGVARRRENELESLPDEHDDNTADTTEIKDIPRQKDKYADEGADRMAQSCYPYEEELIKYVIRLGATYFCTAYDDNNNEYPLTTVEYVCFVLSNENIPIRNEVLRRALEMALDVVANNYRNDEEAKRAELEPIRQRAIAEGNNKIRESIDGDFDMARIQQLENEVKEKADKAYNDALLEFQLAYIYNHLGFCEDKAVMDISNNLYTDRHSLSKYHSKFSAVPSEYEQRGIIINRAIFELRCTIINQEANEITQKMAKLDKSAPDYSETINTYLIKLDELTKSKSELSKILGERIVLPRDRR